MLLGPANDPIGNLFTGRQSLAGFFPLNFGQWTLTMNIAATAMS